MPRVVSNKGQLERLASLMDQNTDLARGLCPKSLAKTRWENIAHELNSFGPPTRSPDAWQRVWNDLKYKTKKKSCHNQAENIATGGGPNNSVPLSNLEESVNRIMNYSTYHNPPGEDFGVDMEAGAPESCNAENEVTEEIEILSEHAPPIPNRTPRRASNRREGKQIALLERQTKDQAEFQKETLKRSAEIESRLANIENYTKKTYYLKKEKFALYKEEIKNKRKDRLAMLELKRQMLEMKRGIYTHRV